VSRCSKLHRYSITSCVGEQRRRHIDTERLVGDQVNDEIELGRLLDWQVARLRAAHDFVDIITGAPEQVLQTPARAVRQRRTPLSYAACQPLAYCAFGAIGGSPATTVSCEVAILNGSQV
jgi:hypothetical protein